jgi:hypothetical protein
MRKLVGALVTVMIIGFPAQANVTGTRDPNDVRGPLDIKRIVHGHGNGGALWHKVVMHRAWGAGDLRGEDEIRFYFSNDREDRFDEVHASVARKNGKIAAWVFPYVEGGDFASVGPSERIRFTRPTRRTVKIFFDKSWLNRRGRYAWSVGSSYRDKHSSSCRENCFDYAPRHDPERLVHDL